MQNKTWAKIIASLAVVLVAASLYVLYRRENDTVVEVYYGGQVQQVIDLTRVKESYVIEVETEDGGHNTILVEPGRICVAEADCPDGICVQQGWLSDQAMPIVCMPHGLVISVRSGAAADGATL